MRVVRSVALVAVTLGLSVASAQASVITLNYDFSVAGFGVGAPVDPVTGSFSVTFDNATDHTDVTSGLSLTGLNLALDSTPAFSYDKFFDSLTIGGVQDGVVFFFPSANDFRLRIDQVSSDTPHLINLYYAQTEPATFQIVVAFGGTLTPPVDGPAVPEPASLTLLGLGLAGMGARRWRQRKT